MSYDRSMCLFLKDFLAGKNQISGSHFVGNRDPVLGRVEIPCVWFLCWIFWERSRGVRMEGRREFTAVGWLLLLLLLGIQREG